MVRTSPCYYISPSAISISPNANGSASDLAVNVVKGAKIKVYSQGIQALGWSDSVFQQWTLTGRNRRLADSTKPYTIYARLAKNNKEDGYLVFAPKEADGDNWLDKYAYVTMQGLATGTANKNVSDYWYVKLGEVSLPTDNARTVSLDTGILGTDQFNTEWNLDPDDMPLRIELSATIDLKDAGSKPYVPWGKELVLRAKLLQGWADTTIPRFHHFTIQRNTGDTEADKKYNYPDGNSEVQSSGRQMLGGNITLSHARGEGDVFNGTVSSAWTVIAWGTKATADGSVPSSSSYSSDTTETYEKLAETTISISAETSEQFSLELSSAVATYDPSSDTYNPRDGIDVMIRAVDQKGEVFKLTNAQRKASSLAIQYCVAENPWITCDFKGADTEVAKTNIPIEAFHSQQNVNVRIVRVVASTDETVTTTYKELDRTHIPLVRNGEDSKEREWIFLRSASAIQFSSDGKDTSLPLIPSLINGGEVKPEEAAAGDDTNKNQDGWVPEGWWDEMRGTDSEYHYEYAAYRDYIKGGVPDSSSSSSVSAESSSDPSKSGNAAQRGGHWGDFSAPRIWSYYAEDAVTYRCRWTLAGVEVYQLKCAYTGAFRGTLPLVGTLMKRVGSGQEQEVKGKTVITLKCEGIDYSKTFNTDNPTFTVNTTDKYTADFVQYLNKVELSGLSVSFTVDGEEHNFSIPVIREADEDSVKDTIDTYGSKKFLRKDRDDETTHKLTMGEAKVTGDATVDGNATVGGDASVKGNSTVGKNLDVNGDAKIAGSTTTHNLTVTGTAHFFELQVDKITAGSGGRITSAADGFTVADVGTVSDGRVKVYWLAQDSNGRAVMNMWRVNDQAICASFNLGQIDETGNGQQVANKYYWCLVTAVSGMIPETRTVNGVEGKYNWIELSTQTKAEGCTVNPAVGDDIAQLGYEGTDDPNRQSAIYESSYVSIDPDLYPPFRATYRGISDFDLKSHRASYNDAKGELIVGNLKVIDDLPDVLTLRQAHNGLVTQTTPDVVEISIKDGYGKDVMSLYTLSVERDSGDATSDTAWNNQHKNISVSEFCNGFSIAYTDLTLASANGATAFVFTLTRTSNGDKLRGTIYERLDSSRQLEIVFDVSNPFPRVRQVDTDIIARLYYGDDDYTDLLTAEDATVVWTRDSGVPTEDNSWHPTLGATPNILKVQHHIPSDGARTDCGSLWAKRKSVTFTCEATVELGGVQIKSSKSISIN